MKQVNEAALFERMAQRARSNASYLGWIFGRYAEIEKKNDSEIAEILGLSIHDLYRLHLCLRPRSTSFIQDVRHIVNRFGIEAASLSRLVRHVEAVEEMKDGAETNVSSEAGLLVAARARKSKAKVSTPKRKK